MNEEFIEEYKVIRDNGQDALEFVSKEDIANFESNTGKYLIIHENGDQNFYVNGVSHRENGPAFIGTNGEIAWYKEGNLHRADGPAIEYSDGEKIYYLNGKGCKMEDLYKNVGK